VALKPPLIVQAEAGIRIVMKFMLALADTRAAAAAAARYYYPKEAGTS
jgi:hypothetical protein